MKSYYNQSTHRNEMAEGGSRQMKKKKTLNYRFHNPNSDKAAAEYLIKIFMEANLKKVEQAMQTAMKTQ